MTANALLPGLPVSRTALFGRARDLAAIRAILDEPETRLLTLSGVGGCGKTRLALQLASDLAADYPRRSWAVEMAAIADPMLIPIVVANALGVQEDGSTSSTSALIEYLQEGPALLLLDNCEHIVDACALFVDTLLVSCPDLRVIVTSREPLHIPGERQYRVPPLDVPDIEELGSLSEIAASPAVQLFVTRAQAILPSFELAPENAEGVARICVRLEGIPLALELAAARVQVLGIQQILVRLDFSFDVLAGGSRVAPTRHQTLYTALAWSDALLTETERTVFRRLTVFSGEFRLDAVESICTDTEIPAEAMLAIVSGLADKSLIMTVSGERVAWHRLLEPIRQYAREGLDSDAEAALRARHAAFYLDLAQRAAAGLRDHEQQHWLNRLERDQGNVRAALEWARQHDHLLELRLVVALARFWEIRGHLTEGLRALRDALARETAAQDPLVHIYALAAAGRISAYFDMAPTTRHTEADKFGEESVRLARALGDAQALADTLGDLGMIYKMHGDFDRAIDCLEEALAIHRELDDAHGIARDLLHLGASLYRIQRTPDDRAHATRLLQESLDRVRELGDARTVAILQVLLGRAAQERGDFEQALALIAEGMEIHVPLDDRWLIASDLRNLAEVLLAAGHARLGVQFAGTAQALADSLGGSVGWGSIAGDVDVMTQVETLRQQARYESAWAEGYALKPEDALQEALALAETLTEVDPTAAPAAPGPESLTPRELQVAHLLADEFSDRQIADALFIAPSTVATHVHHILQKLDLKSRVQVADWLAQQETPTRDSA